jgi:quercetin dioxygenase-like cupin family protein
VSLSKVALLDMDEELLAPGLARRMAFGTNMSMARYEIAKDVIPVGHRHHHPFEQAVLMVEGHARLFVGDEVFDLKRDDLVFIPPDVPHGTEILEDAVVIEFYSPAREDMRSGNDPVRQALSASGDK